MARDVEISCWTVESPGQRGIRKAINQSRKAHFQLYSVFELFVWCVIDSIMILSSLHLLGHVVDCGFFSLTIYNLHTILSLKSGLVA